MTKTDIIRIADTTRRYNFHSHTQFCDGRADMAQFAQAAVDAGFLHYGFSPHSPIPIESPCNMSKDSVPAFLAETKRLQRLYSGRINLYAAMEVDYLGRQWGPSQDYFRQLPLDYIIGSVHFIPDHDGRYVDIDGSFATFKSKMEKFFHNDIRYVVDTFYRQTTDMIEAGGFDILGHFDKIGHNAGHFLQGIEDEPWYRTLVNDLIDLIVDKGLLIEINTKAWEQHRRMFPDQRYLKRLKQARVPMVVNSDAHYTELIDASRLMAFEMLDAV